MVDYGDKERDMKPGFKTTEFWITVVVTVVSLLLASGAFEEASGVGKVLALAAAALASAGYSVARGVVKK